ncbi:MULTISPECIES: methyl-accepting chemotaxis protein [unclassified Dyella]|uniref:methyl-accepting chemotaxis protein n=1 Tax=unclassified Dyella TaxID=2634549 RepID=UPI003F91A6D7
MLQLKHSLKTRLAMILAAPVLLCLVIAAMGIKGIVDADQRATQLYEQLVAPSQAIENSYRGTLIQAIQMTEAMSSRDPVLRKERLALIDKLQQGIDRQFGRFLQSPKTEKLKPIATAIERDHQAYQLAVSRVLGLLRDGNDEAAFAAETSDARPHGLVLYQDMEKISPELDREITASREQDMATYRAMLIAMLAILLIGGATSGLCGWLQIRAIGHSIGNIQEALFEVSTTLDLTCRARIVRMDEIGHTAAALNHLVDRVGQALGSVHDSIGSVSVASHKIATGNALLSSRTVQQAASLEETAASMLQLTQTVKQNAANAHQANALAVNAAQMADTGNYAVQAMVQTMGKISESSMTISEIVGLIEGIAFQTNILALNASVEAAHAGALGRGFAVVASEVRSLAQRSATAAVAIKELIGSSVAIIQDGSMQAADVGGIIGNVQQAVKQVSVFIGEIAAASEEQSNGIEQVNQAVTLMDRMTQQNAILVEEAATAASSLDGQALQLKAAVDAFRLAATC